MKMNTEIFIQTFLIAEEGLRMSLYEPVHEKTNNLHGRKQRRRSASR